MSVRENLLFIGTLSPAGLRLCLYELFGHSAAKDKCFSK